MGITLKEFEEQYKEDIINNPKIAKMYESMKELIKYSNGEKSRVRIRSVQAYTVEPVQEYTSEKIKEIRIGKGLTQDTFAKILGVTKSAVEKWETGKGRPAGAALRLIKLMENNSPAIEQFYRVG